MSLKNHRALTCSDSVFTKFQCDFCPFQSQATRMIRSHIERDHSNIPKPSAKLNSKYFPKTSSEEEEEGSLYSDNWICLLYAGKLKLFFKLLRIFFRNPLKKWNSKYFSKSSSEEMSTDSDNSNLYSSYAGEINRSFFLFYMIIVGILYFGGTPVLLHLIIFTCLIIVEKFSMDTMSLNITRVIFWPRASLGRSKEKLRNNRLPFSCSQLLFLSVFFHPLITQEK